MSRYCISAFARSNVGKKRTNNEDNFYLSGVTVNSSNDIIADFKTDSVLATAVFDGMGGEAAGEVASQITAETYCGKAEELVAAEFSQEAIATVVNQANNLVCTEITKIGKRMGCTFVSFGFCNDNIHIANVGDSRAYMLRDGKFFTLSKDHTVAQSMVDSGMVSYEESQKIKEKHKLTQHIGIFPEEMLIEPYFKSFEAQEGDVILLCSDGLTDMLSDGDIAQLLLSNSTNESRVNTLVEAALQNGGKDNVTVVVATVEVSPKVAEPISGKMADSDMKSKKAVCDKNKKSHIVLAVALIVLVVAVVLAIVLTTKNSVSEAFKNALYKDVVTEINTDVIESGKDINKPEANNSVTKYTDNSYDKKETEPVITTENDFDEESDEKDDELDVVVTEPQSEVITSTETQTSCRGTEVDIIVVDE